MMNLPPDRAQMELHDADGEREMRRRAAQGMAFQFFVMCAVCVVALAVLVVFSLLL